MIEFIFWASLVAMFYIYAGYPALIWFLARFGSNTRRGHAGVRSGGDAHETSGGRESGQPASAIDSPLSVVIVAHNEARSLPRKLASLLDSDCQSRICEILVASDGSTDNTRTVVEASGDPRIRLVHFRHRRGKPSVLNEVVPQCSSDIVVLTDARQELHPAALSRLAANFLDSQVGVVSGELVLKTLESDTTASHGIGIYWQYEKFIRKHEGQFRSVPGATGALYAIRKSLFQPIHPQTLLDDVVIPMQAIVQGYRCVFEPAAYAYDRPSHSAEAESIRKRRTIAGAAQLIAHFPGWLLPWRNPIWLEYTSHKIGRLFSPLCLLAAAITNILLCSQQVYGVLLSVHGCFYLSAIAGWAFQFVGARSKCFGAQLMFVALNIVTVAALWDALRGRYRATWQRTN